MGKWRKFILISWLILPTIFMGCVGKGNRNVMNEPFDVAEKEEVFSPPLKKMLIELIDEFEGQYNVKKDVLFMTLQKIGNECYIIAYSQPGYDLVDLIGYSFLNNRLVLCYDINESCNFNLINMDALTEFRDSIPEYRNVTYEVSNYDALIVKRYKVINADSLQFITRDEFYKDFEPPTLEDLFEGFQMREEKLKKLREK